MLDSSPDCFCLISYRVRGSLMLDAQGYPESSLGVVLGGFGGSPGALLSAPGLLRGTFWGAWGQHSDRFWMISVCPGGVQGETSEKLE